MAQLEGSPAQIGFGQPREIQGLFGQQKASYVPLSLLQNQFMGRPVPILISGANQVKFTLNASATAPAFFWLGNDYVPLESSLSFTWVTGAVNTILNSSGVETANQSAATGVWYWYLRLGTQDTTTGNPISRGQLALVPSQTAPSYVQGPNQCGILGHPGVGRQAYYLYVGFTVCSSAAGAGTYKAMTKVNYTYNLIIDALFVTGAPAGAGLGSVSLAAFMPTHGVVVGGVLTSPSTAAADSHQMAQDASGTGQIAATTSAAAIIAVPFSEFPIPSNAAVFTAGVGHQAGANCQFTQIIDVV